MQTDSRLKLITVFKKSDFYFSAVHLQYDYNSNVIRKSLALVVTFLTVLGLWSSLSFCHCPDDSDCKTFADVTFSANINLNNQSEQQFSNNNCCSDCYEFSEVSSLNSAFAPTESVEYCIALCNSSIQEIKNTEFYNQIIVRGPPSPLLSRNIKVYLETQRILV